MKKLYTLIGALTIGAASIAQNIGIYESGEEEDVSGTLVSITGPNDVLLEHHFDVKNISGETGTFRIERVKILEVEGTLDNLCWGLDCYTTDFVSPSNPFISPDDIELPDGEGSVLYSYFEGEGYLGTVQYRYYVIDEDGTRHDSVDVEYNSVLSVEEKVQLDVSVYPNPAATVVNIELENNVNNIGFALYNVLGEKVIDRVLNAGNNTVNVNNLPNGVYFYSILNKGDVIETKKLVVRH